MFHGEIAGAIFWLLVSSAAAGICWAEGPEPPPIPRGQPLSYYSALVDTKLPAFDGSLLSVANGPDWMAGKTVHQVAQAAGDSDPGTILNSGAIQMGYDPPDGPRYVKLDFQEGYIRYLNRSRSFHAGSPCVAVMSGEAQSSFFNAVGMLGLPTSEWETASVHTVMERSVGGETQDPPTEVTCEIEQMVILNRKASNGLPVFGSEARGSISNLHERARFLIDWPRFLMQTGLIMRTRAEVVGDLAQRIWEAESDGSGLGAMVDLEVAVGYLRGPLGFVPVARAVFADTYSRFDGQVLYMPLAHDPSSDVGSEQGLGEIRFRVHADAADGSSLLDFYLPEAQPVRLTIVDVAGREVRILADARFPSGWSQVEWNHRDSAGRRVARGIYFARLGAVGQAPARKILVIR
jgi:hypothetical protein